MPEKDFSLLHGIATLGIPLYVKGGAGRSFYCGACSEDAQSSHKTIENTSQIM